MAASGYDSRQNQRSSFAFAPAQPVQTRSSMDPGMAGGRVYGGDSGGEVVRASPMTMPDGNDGIPEFLAKMVEPYIRQKQSEAVVKAATDVTAGKSITDIAKGDSGVAGIFGPSGYHQAAATFAATDRLNNAKASILADPEVEKMDAGQLGSYLSKHYQEMMTGDPVTDQLLSHQIMQDHAPLVATLTAKHEAWAANQAAGAASNNWDSRAGGLQQIGAATDLQSPASVQALQQETRNYLSSLQKPYGMTDEVYQKTLLGHAHAALTSGNFYAFEALKAHGLYNILNDEQQARLDTAYYTAASHAFDKVSHDPEINKALVLLDSGIKFGLIKTPDEIRQRAEQINDLAARATGVSGTAFLTGGDIATMQKGFTEDRFQAGLRLEARQWQVEDRNAEWQHQEDAAKRELAENLRVTATMANAGNIRAALETGVVKAADANIVFGRAVGTGNVSLLAQNFDSSSYVNDFAASQLRAPVTSSIGRGVTQGFKSAYRQWQALHAASPAAAVAYFGDHAANMEAYDKAIRGGEVDLAAYAETFGRAPDVGRMELPDGVKAKDARQTVRDAITAGDSSRLGQASAAVGQWFGSRHDATGRTPLAQSSTDLVTNWLLPKAGAYARTSGISIDQAANKLYATAIASGELERAGPFAWINAQGAAKLSSYLALPDDAVDHLVTKVAGEKLARAGFAQGTNGSNYDVVRVNDAEGKPALYIQAIHDDHSGHSAVVVTLDELKAANRKRRQEDLEAAQPHPTPFEVDISREGTEARLEGYRHAMDAKGQVTDIGPPIANALYGALDIVGTSKRTGDAILGAAGDAVSGAVGAMRRQFRSTVEASKHKK